MDSTIVNHHQTTIWENSFGTVSKHRGHANPSFDSTLVLSLEVGVP